MVTERTKMLIKESAIPVEYLENINYLFFYIPKRRNVGFTDSCVFVLMPYADKNDGLFEIKECYNEKTKWSGTQTLITPKGRETFRLLCIGVA